MYHPRVSRIQNFGKSSFRFAAGQAAYGLEREPAWCDRVLHSKVSVQRKSSWVAKGGQAESSSVFWMGIWRIFDINWHWCQCGVDFWSKNHHEELELTKLTIQKRDESPWFLQAQISRCSSETRIVWSINLRNLKKTRKWSRDKKRSRNGFQSRLRQDFSQSLVNRGSRLAMRSTLESATFTCQMVFFLECLRIPKLFDESPWFIMIFGCFPRK